MGTIKRYSELITFPTFYERLQYCKEYGAIGESTFGFERFLNQTFYLSQEWKNVRRQVISRDLGLDLGVGMVNDGDILLVHHLKPLTPDDLNNATEYLLNPEYLITVTKHTHNLIHFRTGTENLPKVVTERTKGDTCPWRSYAEHT